MFCMRASHAHHVSILCIPCWCHIQTMWTSCVHHVGVTARQTMWVSHVHLDFIWVTYVHKQKTKCTWSLNKEKKMLIFLKIFCVLFCFVFYFFNIHVWIKVNNCILFALYFNWEMWPTNSLVLNCVVARFNCSFGSCMKHTKMSAQVHCFLTFYTQS